MNTLLATTQAGLEGLRWLRDTDAVEGSPSQHLGHGNFALATLALARNIARSLPPIPYREAMSRMINPELDLIGIGAEALVFRDGSEVRKYLVGKTEEPHQLADRIQQRHITSRQYMGDYLIPSRVTVERAKLFKLGSQREYVCITQPFIEVDTIDPHHNSLVLESSPEIHRAVRGMAKGLGAQFCNTGLLMDTTNAGNVLWGRSVTDERNELYFIDSLSVSYYEKDFIGKKVPFWDPIVHLESLTALLDRVGLSDHELGFQPGLVLDGDLRRAALDHQTLADLSA